MKLGKGTLEILLFFVWLFVGAWIFGLGSHWPRFILFPLLLMWVAILRYGSSIYERKYMRPSSPNDLSMGQKSWLASPGWALAVIAIGLVWTLLVIKARTVWPDSRPFSPVIWVISGALFFLIINYLEVRWSKR